MQLFFQVRKLGLQKADTAHKALGLISSKGGRRKTEEGRERREEEKRKGREERRGRGRRRSRGRRRKERGVQDLKFLSVARRITTHHFTF